MTRGERHKRLAKYLAQVARRPFAEGQHDCALFAAGAVAAMTGRDLAEEWRGRYSTTRGGIRVLRKSGFEDHIALAASLLAETDAPKPGDLAVVDGPALGVVQGTHIYVAGPDGLALVPIGAGLRFFEVS